MLGLLEQHWLYATQNPHDRGILRTGRHAGDWELVQTQRRTGAARACAPAR